MIQKHVRKFISVLLVMALMSTCLSFGSISASAAGSASCDAVVTKRGLCISGWHNDTDSSIEKGSRKYEPHFYHNVDEMNTLFKKLGVSKPVTFKNTKAGVNKVYETIEKTFKDADSNDINYLYLTGHGVKNKGYMNVGGEATLGTENERLYYSELKKRLDKLTNHGHFIIFIQSCYSGQAINVASQDVAVEEDETITASEEIMEAFFSNDSDIVDEGDSDFVGTSGSKIYTVYCSACKDQQSFGKKESYSWATHAWAEGLGWKINENGIGGKSCDQLADSNKDGVVTATELNAYAKKKVKERVEKYNKQNPDGKIKSDVCYYSRYYFRTIGTIDCPLGDTDNDGDITNKDVLLIRKFIANLKNPNAREKQLADVDGDKMITNKDVLCLQYYIAGRSLPKTK